jgi:Flp pilus assembly protein TadD
LALAGQGRWDEAAAHYSEALRLKADYAEAHNDLATILARQKKFEEAVAHFTLALQYGAQPAEAHVSLGKVCSAQGKTKKALEHHREALRLRPDTVDALNNLAWSLATRPEAQHRDGAEAVKLAERAAELTNHKDSMALDTLAAAYAESGRYSEAIVIASKAIELATARGQKELAGQIKTRLELYESGQPCREP